MRTIKFRAWDVKFNKWLYPYPEGFYVIGEVTAFDIIGMQLKESTTELTTLERIGDVELVQFTGLLDKNGKEIYEGDIVRGYKPSHGIETTVVTFDNGCFLMTCSRWPLGDWTKDDSYIEVIGNIYENPELLKP